MDRGVRKQRPQAQNNGMPNPPAFASPAPGAESRTTSASISQSRLAPGISTSPSPINPKIQSAAPQQAARRSRDSLKSKPATTTRATSPFPDKEDQLLQTLKKEYDLMRALVTCNICYDLLYEPYTTSCGHTYCYNCLCKSFTTNKSTNCPECRTPLKHAPAPAYLVRSLTLSFTKHANLLPAGDSLAEHNEKQRKHAEDVQRDKKNTDTRTGGLFKGLFRRFVGLRPIRDDADGVERCPYCTWELEDGMCPHCGLPFDENGDGMWSESLSGASDMDQTSENLSSEGPDHEMEIEMEEINDELGIPGAGDPDLEYDDWVDQEDVFDAEMYDIPYMVQRYMGGDGHLPARFRSAPRPRAAHSAAGSRRRSYTPSIHESEMNTVEEEEEEDADGDSSMNDFTNDEDTTSGSQSSTSVSESTPQPVGSWSTRQAPEQRVQPGPNHRQFQPNRRPQLSSQPQLPGQPSTSAAIPPPWQTHRYPTHGPVPPQNTLGTIDGAREDEEDEGPVPRGRQQQNSQQPARPTNRRNRRIVVDEDDDDWTYRPLDRVSQAAAPDEDEDADSDGTTIGLAQSSSPSRTAQQRGSLTPTADRPNAPLRPPSRSGSSRLPLGSRGLRRRSSVLSISSPIHYEDNDADDEDVDQDGDTNMAQSALRHHPSVIRIRHINQDVPPRNPTRGQTVANPIDVGSDDSETSGRLLRAGQQARRLRQDYDPRISFLFAQHLEDVSQLRQNDPLDELDTLEQMRAMTRTPLARPRTSNRNRPSNTIGFQGTMMSSSSMAGQQYLPNTAGRLRTVSTESNSSPMHSRPSVERAGSASSRMPANDLSRAGPTNREASVASIGRSEASNSARSAMPSSSAGFSPLSNGSVGETIERPASRVSFRAQATPRRGSGQFMPAPYQPGLNIASAFQNNNPFFNPTVRPRVSTQRLREQSSTATLRPRNSIRVLRHQGAPPEHRDGPRSPTHVRIQPSRINLRTQPSVHRLQAQPSSRALRQVHHQQAFPREPMGAIPGFANPRSGASSQGSRSSPGTNSTLSEDERQRRAREMVERRSAELRTNPFTRNPQHSNSGRSSAESLPTGSVRTSSVAPNTGPPVGATIQPNAPPQSTPAVSGSPASLGISPTLGRRRSNRLMSQAPAVNTAAVQGSFQRVMTGQHQSHIRSQQHAQLNITRAQNQGPTGGNGRQN